VLLNAGTLEVKGVPLQERRALIEHGLVVADELIATAQPPFPEYQRLRSLLQDALTRTSGRK
jgi:hypothetical protein